MRLCQIATEPKHPTLIKFNEFPVVTKDLRSTQCQLSVKSSMHEWASKDQQATYIHTYTYIHNNL